MLTDWGEVRLAEFADQLRGERIAIVYSHRFGVPLDENWYHRWQTNVIAMFSQAVEHCGAIPVFFDIEQWIAYCATPRDDVRFMVNLNAGNRSLDQLSIAPALGGWRGMATFPCSAFTALLGEDKDTAKWLARYSGWHRPRNHDEGLAPDHEVIRKPRTYGSSVGLERVSLSDVEQPDDPEFIVEEFIRGYDATVVTFFSAISGKLECQGAQAMMPDTEDPADWVYDAFEKRNPNVQARVTFPYCPVEPELARHAVELTRVFGGRFVSRVDVRVKSPPSPSTLLRFADCAFLKINPMPTIGPPNSVTELAAQFVERNEENEQIAWIVARMANRIERAAIYLLSCGLMVLSSK